MSGTTTPPFRPRLDLLGGAFIRLDRRRRSVFPDGWGDESVIHRLTSVEMDGFSVEPAAVVWRPKEEHRGIRIRKGTYASPVAHLLPIEARAGSVEWWSPPAGDTRVAVMLPAWNDEGFLERRKLAGAMVASGISVMMLEAPLYGSRRRHDAPPQPIRTLADFMTLGFGTVAEGIALTRVAAEEGTPGLTGYSMGGSLAALAAAMSADPVAVAPLAASYSPEAVVFDGMIRNGVDWKSFEGRIDTMRAVLDTASTLHRPPLPHLATAVLVAATADGFVPPEASALLARHWDAEIRWVEAGHGTLLARHRPILVQAVVDSFTRFESYLASGAP